jgi:PIN domain nuclease of toxin-antitoxin system
LVLSVVNYWEVVIKSKKGLLHINDPVGWWNRTIESLGSTILSIRANHVSALSGLPDLHKDPFDRMLLAQAAAEGLTLITSDSQMRRYSVETLW